MLVLRKTLKALLTLAVLCLSLPAFAETLEESVVRQLRAQGFTEFEVERTLLGRLKIEAKNATIEREIVINPTTGEILRDYWEYRSGNKRSSNHIVIPQVGGNASTSTTTSSSTKSTTPTSTSTTVTTTTRSSNSGSGSVSSGRDDRVDDDEKDDDDRSSNSGKGNSDDREDDRDEDDGRDDDKDRAEDDD